MSPKSGTLKSPPKGFDTTAINKSYYNVVLQNILETEHEYSKELQSVLSTYLRPLQTSEKLSSANTSYLMGNLEEISSFQQVLVQSLEECTKSPEAQQRVGGCFLSLMPQMRTLYLAYCANHPSAVSVLTEHRFVAKPSGTEGKEGGHLCPLGISWSVFKHSKGKFAFLKMSARTSVTSWSMWL